MQPSSDETLASSLSDLFKYRFVNCKLINSTFLHNKEGCILDFSDDFNNAYMIYFVNFLGTLAVLPGNIVSALLMDKIGRLRMLGKEVGRVASGPPVARRCLLTVCDMPPLPPQRAPASFPVSAVSS